MTLPVILLPKANEDIRDQLSYLSEFGAEIVVKLTDALEITFNHLSNFPESGTLRFYYHSRLKHIRQWPKKGSNKLLLF